MQKETPNKLYEKLEGIIPKNVLTKQNKTRKWKYGYNSTYNIIIISKTGQIGDIISINGLDIALPLSPVFSRTRLKNKTSQYWVRQEYPKTLSKIQTIFQWNEMPATFKNLWVDYIEREFERREEGHWFLNNGEPTYITGSHYMYLQWTKIDVGFPDFREANRLFYIYWEACKADPRSFGICYLKIRRSGFSFMGSGS